MHSELEVLTQFEEGEIGLLRFNPDLEGESKAALAPDLLLPLDEAGKDGELRRALFAPLVFQL